MSANFKNSAVATGLEKMFSFQSQRRAMSKNVQTIMQLCSFHMLAKLCSKSFKLGSAVKNPPANAGDAGSIPGSGSSHGEGNGNPLQDSCLGNPKDRGAWRATVHGATKESSTTQ